MAKLTKELINSAPWAEIREYCKTHMIKEAFSVFIDGKYPINLKQFRGHCAQKLITSPISEEEKERQAADAAKKEVIKYTKEEEDLIISNSDNVAVAKMLGRTPKGIRQKRAQLKDRATKKVGAGKGKPILDAIDWAEAIRWVDAKDPRNMKLARAKFAPGVLYYAFRDRMKEERKKLAGVDLSISIIPAAQHKQLKPMWGQWAA